MALGRWAPDQRITDLRPVGERRAVGHGRISKLLLRGRRTRRTRQQRVPFRFQVALKDCAPACVQAIAEYYGIGLPVHQIRRLATDPGRGTTVGALAEGLGDLFEVEVGRAPGGTVPATLTPFIAHLLKLRHFVVVWSVDERRGQVLLGDPSAGVTVISVGELVAEWGGVLVVLRPRRDPEVASLQDLAIVDGTPGVGAGSLAAGMRMAFRSAGRWLALVAILGVAGGVASTAFSAAVPRLLVDPTWLMAAAGAFTVVGGILSALGRWVSAEIVRRQCRILGDELADVLAEVDRDFYTVGDFYTRFGDIQHLVDALVGLARDAVYGAVLLIGVVGYLFLQNWPLAVLLAGLVLTAGAVITPFVLRARGLTYRLRLRASSLNEEVAHAWNGGAAPCHSWPELVDTAYHQALWLLPVRVAVGQVPTVGLLAVVAFGSRQHPGLSGLPDILGLLTFMGYLTGAATALYQHYSTWQVARPAVQRVADVLAMAADPVGAAAGDGGGSANSFGDGR